MEQLFKGAVRFRQRSFEKHKELFKKLGQGQKPHTLFIGCSDSRVVPELITKAMPGELFVVRNIANIVPKYRISKEYAATTAAIEFAVLSLGVENIVICGHSNCGGCSALFKSKEEMANIPNVEHWLDQAQYVREQVEANFPDVQPEEREWITEQLNIVEQMKNILTYPLIAEKYQKGELKLYGWYYVIGTGEVYNYNMETEEFELIGA
ncbi:carbonic anhydrase [Seleniivibrio woodruffii]|uniref:Carbonic anhydrase n=1 Tax=Seleniivibrio woodruffii TaxID=1078050 RepID=A0A4R1KEE1_9BACT|nr:carbonic anhydrase [Seleniivibrio woodruffii]TCK62497.1 carbonic anhydrase [Seleniivibrio woodruffii]TVZ37076.1 carbonic anhydrase [Seleniivibrio woodruffii]